MKSFILFLIFFLFTFGSADGQVSENNFVLILNKSGNTAWQLDAESGERLVEYETGDAPHEVAISPDRSRAIITNYGSEKPGNSLTIVNLQSQEVSKTISLGEFERPHGVEWFSDGQRAIVTAEGKQAVLIVDINSEKILTSIKTNQDVSHMVSLGPDENTAYITNLGSGSVSILDLSTEEVIQHIPTGDGTEGVTTVPDKNEVWITNRSANNVSILDAGSNQIVEEMGSSTFPIRAEISPNQQWVAVSNAQSSEVAVFEVESRELIRKISTVPEGEDGMPIGLTFSDDGSRLFVANSGQDQITVIDTDSWQVISTFDTGDTPDGIAFISNS